MEEKKSLKVSLGTVICIFIILLLVVALGVVYYLGFVKNNQEIMGLKEEINSLKNKNNISQSEKIDNDQEESKNEQINKINKVYEEKEIVYTSYSEYSSEYSYSIPYINIDSDDAKRINNEIESYYKPLIEEEIKNKSQGYSVSMYNVKYNSYVNDNILSLVVSNEYPNDCIGYKVYNLDIYNGDVVTNSEIINSKNITESKFLNTAKECYNNEFINKYGSKEQYINNLRNAPVGWTESELEEQTKIYEEQLNKTVSQDNYSIQTPMFLNESGNLCLIAPIYSLAGAELYYSIVNVNI